MNLAVDRSVIDRIGVFHEGVGQRPGWRATGDDSFFAWKAIEAGIPIYYQPAAVVFHRVPPSRATRRFLLERCYLEGITHLDMEEKRGILRRTAFAATSAGTAATSLKSAGSLATLHSLAPWNDPRVFETLGRMALSVGIVRRGARLLAQVTSARP